MQQVRELEGFALRRLPSMQLADGVFCTELRAGQSRPEGRSLRHTLVVQLGLSRAEEHDFEHSLHLGALRSHVLSELGAEELTAGDLGLALWAESRAGGGAVGELVAALRTRLGRGALESLPSAELGWLVTGLTEAGARAELGEGEAILGHCRSQLLEERRPRGGLVTHAARGPRKRLPSFADQAFALLALTQLSRIRDDREACEAARSIGDLLLENRMPNGAWPLLYDPVRGSVVEPYEIRTVHQDSLAMIALHGLTEATQEPRYREAAVSGLDWVSGANELGVEMLDAEAGLIYESIRRKQRFPRAQQVRTAAAAYLRAAPRPADAAELEIDRVMRSDHLGWLLEAWAGREHLARGDRGVMEDYEGSLRRAELAADPVEQFAAWFTEAQASVELPEAMALATADESGAPAVRFVLLKAFGPEGFDFYTDYRSNKARDLEANAKASLAIWWKELGRQVRVTGEATRLPESESDLYFASRPRGAQLGAWASEQSSLLENRAQLQGRLDDVAARFRGARHRAPAALGRLPHRPGVDRVLAAGRGPPSRPLPLQPRG